MGWVDDAVSKNGYCIKGRYASPAPAGLGGDERAKVEA
jgi:hypothetical protein